MRGRAHDPTLTVADRRLIFDLVERAGADGITRSAVLTAMKGRSSAAVRRRLDELVDAGLVVSAKVLPSAGWSRACPGYRAVDEPGEDAT